ncbi:hypothetical protein Efla_005930 [Eimeria flavescens]
MMAVGTIDVFERALLLRCLDASSKAAGFLHALSRPRRAAPLSRATDGHVASCAGAAQRDGGGGLLPADRRGLEDCCLLLSSWRGSKSRLPSARSLRFFPASFDAARCAHTSAAAAAWGPPHASSSPPPSAASGPGGPAVLKVEGRGFSALRSSVCWGRRRFDFFVVGVDPEGGGEDAHSALAAVKALQALHPDLVLLGLGCLDREKIGETFSREALLRSGEPEALESVLPRDNGQFIPAIQQLLISGVPHYPVGRDRLVEMGALGRQLLRRPAEFYGLVLKLLKAKKEKEALTPSLKQVLSEDSSEFCLLKIHQYLLEWTDSPLSAPEPAWEISEKKAVEKWLVGRNKSECNLRTRAKQLELARLPLPPRLKAKGVWRVLVVSDLAQQERLAGRLAEELSKLEGEAPRFARMFQLEDTSSTRFHLCLMIYLGLPIATLCRLLWKMAKNAYLEYWVKGSTVSVSGDEVLARLGGEVELPFLDKDKRKENLEIVESKWLGLWHSVRDKSRD